MGLAAGCAGVDEVVALDQESPACDVQAPLMSLPGIFGTTLSTVPADVPYLQADAGKVEEWRGRLQEMMRRAGSVSDRRTLAGGEGSHPERKQALPKS